MSEAAANRSLTPEDYLANELAAPDRNEFVRGEVHAMSGGTFRHNVIASNLIREIGTQLKGRPCVVLGSDMKVRVEDGDAFFYPDVSALCGEVDLYDEKDHVITNPSFIAEILSESTEARDRGEKFQAYMTLTSLSEYLLLSQHRMSAELRRRNPETKNWELAFFNDPHDSVELASIGCKVQLASIYENVAAPE